MLHGMIISLMALGSFGLFADPDACIQRDYRPNVPSWVRVDPAAVADGVILAPVPGDPNTWELPLGPWTRPEARACDPEADAFEVLFLGGTSQVEPACLLEDGSMSFYNPKTGKWSFTATVQNGPNLWSFLTRSLDGRNEKVFRIVTVGGINQPPVLE